MKIDVVEYKRIGDLRLEMSLISPEVGRSCPAIVWFVCGGWTGFSPVKQYPHAQYFASRGIVSFIALVRVQQHGTSPVECVVDARSAIRWVRGHAGDYGVDPDRIVAAGGSASGHVSACTAMLDGYDDPQDDLSISCKPNALALYCPAINPCNLPKHVDRFGGIEKVRQLSPSLHVKGGLPPMVIMHGMADEAVPVQDSIAFAKAMIAAGNRCDLKLYDGEGHGFQNYFDGKQRGFPGTARDTDRFLASLGYIHGEPTIDEFQYDGPLGPKFEAARQSPASLLKTDRQ